MATPYFLNDNRRYPPPCFQVELAKSARQFWQVFHQGIDPVLASTGEGGICRLYRPGLKTARSSGLAEDAAYTGLLNRSFFKWIGKYAETPGCFRNLLVSTVPIRNTS